MKNLSIIALITAGLVVGSSFAAPPPRTSSVANQASNQPLTYENVVAHFKAAHLRATEVQKRCAVFFEGEWKNRDVYDYALIIVENSDEDIQVTFYLTDAHEMNWITEFLDSPLFAPSETQTLFGLMNSGRDVKDRQIGRFPRVDFHHWRPRHAEIFVFSLTPGRPGR